MGFPLTKVVKLSWDGVNWRDFETGVLVTGVLPPYPTDSAEYSGECVKAPEPGSYEATFTPEVIARLTALGPGEITHEPFNADQRTVIQEMIERTIRARSVPKQLVYFVESDWLITYAYHRDTVRALSHEINQLERRIEKLERPWWKRW